MHKRPRCGKQGDPNQRKAYFNNKLLTSLTGIHSGNAWPNFTSLVKLEEKSRYSGPTRYSKGMLHPGHN
jgi:hypothetical protein